ncbi:MAG: coenzyme F420-0:L-glutamate ligase [Patescibacteria group bacterium]
MKRQEVRLIAIPSIPLIREGDNLGAIIRECCDAQNIAIRQSDILVVAQKIVSKAEGAVINLKDVVPSEMALELAGQTGRDARLCQVYIDESAEILRVKGRMVITRHRLGFECSGSGVDRSNIAPHSDETVVLLPKDPDQSARIIRETIKIANGKSIAVIISDSFGRNDRDGSIGTAIGIAGIAPLELREQRDLFGNPANSRIALVDELAAAASIIMGQADESFPVVLIRGARFTTEENASIKKLLFLD